jgi:hypothetical protein
VSKTTKPSYVRRLGLERAVKSGFGIFVRGRIQPSIALGLPRPVVRVLTEKACRERINRENAATNRKARREARKINPQKQEFQKLVSSMTRRQRRLWVKKGYKGLEHKDIKAVKKFMAFNPI